MLKKIFLILLILSSLFIYNNSFANLKFSDEQLKKNTLDSTKKAYDSASQKVNEAQSELNKFNKEDDFYSTAQTNLESAKAQLNTASENYNKAKSDYDNSSASQEDLSSRGFQVKVSELSPGNESEISKATTTEQVINMTLGNIIQKLMIGLGSVSLLVMTFGGGYMIFFHGQDELLSKGKSMFTSGIIALIVSLSSYYMVDLLRFILYS